VLITFSLQSCQEAEFTSVQESTFHHDYATNFEKTFGKISPNQTWDFSSYALHQKALENASTRAFEDYVSVASTDGYYYVETETNSWLDTNLREGRDNRSKITRSVFRTEEKATVFEIVPIYQGQAGLVWSLNLSMHPDGDKVSEIPLWSKGQNIQVYENVGSNWYPRYEWTAIGTNGNTIDASQVRSKPILVEIPAYTTFYFYLEITDNSGVSNYGSVGDKLTSISNPVKIGVLKGLDRPSNIPEKYSSLIVGCEDAPRNSDHDFNDVVFLLTGYAPEVIYDDVLRETYIRKRYLIEDLGNTYDFDFNDIVVDVTQTTTTKWIVNTETGEVTPKEGEEPTVKQEATITYLCGTLPHQITVGNTTFGQVTDPTNLEQTKAQLVKDPSILGEGTTCAQGSIPGIYPSVTNISVH